MCNTGWMMDRLKDDARGGLHRVVMNCRQVGNGPRLKLVQYIGTVHVEIDYITSDSGYVTSRKMIETCVERIRAVREREKEEEAAVIDDRGVMVGRSRGP
jgi:hypothetical protein